MSTTAQEAQTAIATPGEAPAADETTEAEATTAPATQPRASSRSYVLFEEARAETWTKLGEVEADTQEAALETLGEQKLKSGQRFMAIPARFVRPVKPSISTVTTISFE
jgi:hypothetical protein